MKTIEFEFEGAEYSACVKEDGEKYDYFYMTFFIKGVFAVIMQVDDDIEITIAAYDCIFCTKYSIEDYCNELKAAWFLAEKIRGDALNEI